MNFKITSKDLEDGGTLPHDQVFNGFGFDGKNLSPHLAWEGEPEDTESFVVTAYDPDAPTGSGWWHWTVVDIPKNVHELATGASSDKVALPEGALQARTDYGFAGYGGAAPPPGKPHRYIFTVYAVKIAKLGIDAEASGAMVGYLTRMNVLASASLTVTFGVS